MKAVSRCKTTQLEMPCLGDWLLPGYFISFIRSLTFNFNARHTPLQFQEGWAKSLALYKAQRWNVLTISLPQFPSQLLPEEETMRYCLCVCVRERQSAFHSKYCGVFLLCGFSNLIFLVRLHFEVPVRMSYNVFKHLVFIFHFCVNEKSTISFPEMEQGFYPMWSLAWNVA